MIHRIRNRHVGHLSLEYKQLPNCTTKFVMWHRTKETRTLGAVGRAGLMRPDPQTVKKKSGVGRGGFFSFLGIQGGGQWGEEREGPHLWLLVNFAPSAQRSWRNLEEIFVLQGPRPTQVARYKNWTIVPGIHSTHNSNNLCGCAA